MTKIEAYNDFWQQFGVPAYDEFSVPDEAKLPYITYELSTDTFDNQVTVSANIWTRNTSWKQAYDILDRVEKRILGGGSNIPYDGGTIWITSASPWCRRLSSDTDSLIKRLFLNLSAEFI